ncbi:MAG: ribbon-helix-helix protein, CopG family [Candidatus Riesia sp.]|nr:ribbon-helix-helix protein, CopG family [Candidatus Riesia sp.]
MSKDKRIVFRVDEELYDKFKKLCEQNGKSISKVLRSYMDKVVDNSS